MRRAKRIIIAVVGGTVLLLGVIMIFLPGPAILIIPGGLAILATEFEWARRWLNKCRRLLKRKSPAGAEPAQACERSEASLR
ncbi:MAG: PGPGW domain-containing protein [Verrucomicrobiota bacterium]